MNILYYICIGMSAGLLIGFAVGGIKTKFFQKPYSEKKLENTRKFAAKAVTLLKYATFMLLSLGLIWCVYFLILGIVSPGQSDYANNMAELVVAVLTVISILFAFVEFVRRKEDQ